MTEHGEQGGVMGGVMVPGTRLAGAGTMPERGEQDKAMVSGAGPGGRGRDA